MDLYTQYEYLETDEEEITEENSDQVPTTVLEDIYNIDKRLQDDLNLIAVVEGNPRLYAKGKAGYKNVQEKEMAWVSIGKVLNISGSDAKHRWDTLRNLYSRSRRELLALAEQQGRSGSGRDNVSYENLLTPQSMAIHRFMSHLYIPRKTLSNYTKSMSSASCTSSSGSKNILPLRPVSKVSKSFLTKRPRPIPISDSEESATSLTDSLDVPICKENFVDNISKNKESIGGQASDCSFVVPSPDIKKRKKTDLEIESVIKESSKSITAACSALPTFLQTQKNATSKADTEEDESLMSFLSHGLKPVPVQQKIRCMIKILEVLESFQQK
ncbi:uncharacterized protein [Temnothorax nylanderi]|uniref:uncharacterized protein n=1 Tax=Temnothorax nylanderi TaxID=102681 RepID=UPI003A88D53A